MNQQLFQKIRTMKLRRSSRHGTAVYRYEDAAAESSRSASYVEHSAEVSLTTLPTTLI